MQKAQVFKIADSNIENYGGQDHKDAKKAKADAEAEFKGAGAAVGVEVWRIENFGVKKYTYSGKFFTGDSYIILNTYKNSGQNTMRFNAHFWLGEESTQDERGTAAFKVVELDDLLGDMPVQYRETQGYESKEFMKLFDGDRGRPNLQYLKGGIASAFKSVKPTEYTPRLMHFKGRKRIRVTEVACAAASLNNGDVFLLDLGLELIQWNGPASSPKERRKAMEAIVRIKDDRNGRPSSRILDGLEDDETFWGALGGKPAEIAEPTSDSKVSVVEPKIFHISDESGEMTCTQVAEGKSEMKLSLLNNDDVYIVDLGIQVYVWVGSGSNSAERKAAMRSATGYLQASGRPMHTPITRVMAGTRDSGFSAAFNTGPSM